MPAKGRNRKHTPPAVPAPAPAPALAPPRMLDRPVFAQPSPTADPTTFRVPHPSDGAAYKVIDALNREHKIHPLPFPPPRGGVEPQLTLQQVLGDVPASVAVVRATARNTIQTIQNSGQLVFHSLGDCGSTRGPATQNEVVDKLLSDFQETDARELPQFHLLLGDIVYSFGEIPVLLRPVLRALPRLSGADPRRAR